ncbi:MAG TPA: DUF4743 domain-containing protein [Stellaceae bacterium]|jgi:8-oxo-dGTP pyrophosphatase MutT (NUDIX family)|nr:DUF4743 domain-containing protein [Stellaceae bacterium]
MSYLDHVLACNRFEPDDFLPLMVPEGRIGFVRSDHVRGLDLYPDLFDVTDRAVLLRMDGPASGALEARLTEVTHDLMKRGLLTDFRDELFDVSLRWNAAPLFAVDRGAVPFFGIRGHGVHLNGILRGDAARPLRGADRIWVGRRSATKPIDPDKLDNIVAGGVSASYDAFETLVKEAEEEASMPEALIRRARPAGALRYRLSWADGMRDDVLFVYDLDVPEDFTPSNSDGEFEEFFPMTMADCLARIDTTDDFKFNVNLVILDLAIRNGLIGPEHPDYLDIAVGLRGGLIRGMR